MTTTRVGVALIVLGIALLVAGALEVSNTDLLEIFGVGLVVFGAVGICIGTEQRET